MCAVICTNTERRAAKKRGKLKGRFTRMIYEAYNTKESIISTIVGNQLITVDIASFRVEMKPPITWT